jgi:hypothetical protein
MTAMTATQLNSMIMENKIRENSIIAIRNSQTNTLNNTM